MKSLVIYHVFVILFPFSICYSFHSILTIQSIKKITTVFNYRSNHIEDSDKSYNEPYNHLPFTDVQQFREKFGYTTSILGDWSCRKTRIFYKLHLPISLKKEGYLGLTLEERAYKAVLARNALRLYSRERCFLYGRVYSELFAGMKHLKTYGYCSTSGLSWEEAKLKYYKEAQSVLGPSSRLEDESFLYEYVYKRIIEKSCTTNPVIDNLYYRRFNLFPFENSENEKLSLSSLSDYQLHLRDILSSFISRQSSTSSFSGPISILMIFNSHNKTSKMIQITYLSIVNILYTVTFNSNNIFIYLISNV